MAREWGWKPRERRRNASESRPNARERGRNARERGLKRREWRAPLYFDGIVELTDKQLEQIVRRWPERVAPLASHMADHLGGDWNGLNFDFANTVVNWFQRLAEACDRAKRFDLLSDVAQFWFPLDIMWDRWSQAARSRDFLRALRGKGARAVAAVIVATDGAAKYFADEGSWLAADPAIRAALGK